MAEQRLRFSEHAIDRMLESEIEVEDVEAALAGGETIEDYDDGSQARVGPIWGSSAPCRRGRRGWGGYCGDRVRAGSSPLGRGLS